MLNILNNALRNEEYYICLYQNHIYIYNYECILSFSTNTLKIKLINSSIKISGTNIKIKRLETKELLIEGNITGVSYE